MSWNNYPENWEKEIEPIEILEIDRIPQQLNIGEKYHCSWANNGCVWRLVNINNNIATLETPRGRKQITTHINTLRVLNKVALQQAKQRIKKSKK